jgi:hypothetical protein
MTVNEAALVQSSVAQSALGNQALDLPDLHRDERREVLVSSLDL